MSTDKPRPPGDVSSFLEHMARRALESSPFPMMHEKFGGSRKSGSAQIVVREVTENEVFMQNLRHARDGRMEFLCCPMRITVLGVNGALMMSDAPMERITCRPAYDNARGSVLIAGLGLGMIVDTIAEKDEVTDVTVVEINADVIELVRPVITSKKVTIVHQDIHKFLSDAVAAKPRRRFDCIWLDIWPDIAIENEEEMIGMRLTSRRVLARGGWLGTWGWDIMKEQKRKGMYD